MFRSLAIAASGLSAQRQRMEVIASNIANAETTRAEDGGPYRRRLVQMEPGAVEPQPALPPFAELIPLPDAQPNGLIPRFSLPLPPLPPLPSLGDPALPGTAGVRVSAVEEDAAEGPLVYDPGHPDADAAGYVRYPNVRLTDELVEMMDARRVYEANATVFQAAKAMLRKSIEL